jgi:hypothetical protein
MNLQLNGFQKCEVDLQAYNISTYIEKVRGLGQFQMQNGLYPHRTASFFSTIARCVSMVRKAEETDWFRSKLSGYKTVMISRIEVLENAYMSSNVNNSKAEAAWWTRVQKYDLIALRRHSRRVVDRDFEDRFFFGGLFLFIFQSHSYNTNRTNRPVNMRSSKDFVFSGKSASMLQLDQIYNRFRERGNRQIER